MLEEGLLHVLGLFLKMSEMWLNPVFELTFIYIFSNKQKSNENARILDKHLFGSGEAKNNII